MPARGAPPRLLLILPTSTYQADAFLRAAHQLGIALTVASERPSSFERANPAGLLTLDIDDPPAAAEHAVVFANRYPVDAVLGVDDRTALAAAVVSEALGLPTNPPAAMRAAWDKSRQRQLMSQAGVPVPAFSIYDLDEPVEAVAAGTRYPCVLKPLNLSASRGVIRADDPDGFIAAQRRLTAIVESAGAEPRYLVEQFVPGPEFALEGYLIRGQLHPFTVFDKPDPLDGPFFEESIYLTPSTAPTDVRQALVSTAQGAARALGLTGGPVHVELRYNVDGPWLIELGARSIGGRCGQVLRFGPDGGESLEQVLVRGALGLMGTPPVLSPGARGVMMIPTPRAGVLLRVSGLEAARSVPGVDDVTITVHPGQQLVPPPDGARYLGFIFAAGADTAIVETALRTAHGMLEVEFDHARSDLA